MKKIMYHIHKLDVNEKNNDLWEVGKTFDNTKDEFINEFYNTSIGFNTKVFFDGEIKCFSEMLRYFTNVIEEKGRISNNLTKQLIDNAQIYIGEQDILRREIAVEEVRKTYYPDLISRISCIWLCDEQYLDYWKNKLAGAIRVFKVEIDGELFVTTNRLLPKDYDSYEECMKKAHDYWNPKLRKDDTKEYLFRGNLTILEELNLDNINTLKNNDNIDEIIYNKLVRDNIPGIIKKEDRKPITRTLNNQEYHEELLGKLYEECIEVNRAKNKQERLKECADILEIIETIIKKDGYSNEDLIKEQEIKRKCNGGFTKRIFLEKVVN